MVVDSAVPFGPDVTRYPSIGCPVDICYTIDPDVIIVKPIEFYGVVPAYFAYAFANSPVSVRPL